MKRCAIFMISLLLLIPMAGCGLMNPEATAGSSTEPKASSAAPSQAPGQEPGNAPALWFSGEMADPQNLYPTYKEGTLAFEGALYPDGSGGYETALSLTRHFPQGINFVTGEPQPDGYINFGYDSVGSVKVDALSQEAKAALDEKSAGDVGERQYGLLPIRNRVAANTMQTSGEFYLPTDYLRHYSTTMELPYLLITEGYKAVLYLQLNPLATVKLEGALTVPPQSEPHQSATAAKLLYFNDEGRTPEQDKLKDVWNILFLGEKSGGSYDGTLRLWRYREQTGSAPTALCYLPGEASAYKQTVSINFKPFSEAEYLSVGGQLNARERARLSGMATADCGGQTVIFTICCETVYAELPSVGIGVLEGRFSDDESLGRIYEESLTLYQAAHTYHMSPLSPAATDFNFGTDMVYDPGTSSMMQDNAKTVLGTPGDVPSYIPDGFIKMLNPVGLNELRPATLVLGYFQYTEDGYWLDEVGPLYRELLAGMRDLRIEEGETGEGTGYEMEITFRYGERTVGYYMMDTPIGAGIQITIY